MKVRIGILVDDFSQPYWVKSVLNKLLNDNAFELTVVVTRSNKPAPRKLTKSSFNYLPYWIFKFIDRLFYRIFLKKYSSFDIFEKFDIRGLFNSKSVAFLPCEVIETKFSDEFKPSDIEKLRNYDCDLFLRFGFRILKGKILELSKLGIWSLHHGDNNSYRGGPAGFWEFADLANESSAILQILSSKLDAGLVLDKVSVQTNKLNYHANCITLYANATGMLLKGLDKLKNGIHEDYLDLFKKNTSNNNIEIYSSRIYRRPSFQKGVKVLIDLILRYLSFLINKIFFFEQWCLYFRVGDFENEIKVNISQFTKIKPPRDRYWADPFFIETDHSYVVFVEEYKYREKKGKIALIEIDKGSKKWHYKGVVLEENFHLSFPNVFIENDSYYMIPESQESNSVRLYKSVDFPFKWVLERVLIDNISAVDPIIYNDKKFFWLFVNESKFVNSSASSNLSLYYASDLLAGIFTSHKSNPLASTISNSRNAGNIFNLGTKLYRPSQDCSVRYGYAININEINELSLENYSEVPLNKVLPSWNDNLLGTHTFSHSKNFIIIDANEKISRYFPS